MPGRRHHAILLRPFLSKSMLSGGFRDLTGEPAASLTRGKNRNMVPEIWGRIHEKSLRKTDFVMRDKLVEIAAAALPVSPSNTERQSSI